MSWPHACHVPTTRGGRAPSPRVHHTTGCVCMRVSRVSAHMGCARLHSDTHTAQTFSAQPCMIACSHHRVCAGADHKHTLCTLVPAHTHRHSLQTGPPCTHRTHVCSPCTLLVPRPCTHTLCTHKHALTVHACTYTRVHAKWCSRRCPPAHTHTRARLPVPGSPVPAVPGRPAAGPRFPLASPRLWGSDAGFGGAQQIELPWQRGAVD